MDGSFACPECGYKVEVRGLAPGRQVRCGFCHRLLEVPYLPRAADASWKRQRYARPKWVPWAWIALAAVSALILLTGAVQFLKRQYDSIQDRSISQLFDSARRHEADGRLGEALIDLDTALELAQGGLWPAAPVRGRAIATPGPGQARCRAGSQGTERPAAVIVPARGLAEPDCPCSARPRPGTPHHPDQRRVSGRPRSPDRLRSQSGASRVPVRRPRRVFDPL